MIEKQPQILCSMQAFLNAATSGPSRRHMISGLVSIDSPCSAYSGNTTRSMVPRLRRALPTISTILCVCAARSAGVTTTGSCSCTSPMTRPFSDLLRPPSPLIAASLGDREFARHVARRGLAARRDDHDDERQDVGGGVEEVVALGDADGLQRRAERTGGAEEQRRPDALDGVPAREDDEGDRH